MGYFREPNNPHPSSSWTPSKVALLIAQTVQQLLSGGVGEESFIFAFWSPQLKHSKHQKGPLA